MLVAYIAIMFISFLGKMKICLWCAHFLCGFTSWQNPVWKWPPVWFSHCSSEPQGSWGRGVDFGLGSERRAQSILSNLQSVSAFFIVQLSHPYMTTGKTIALTIQTFVGNVSALGGGYFVLFRLSTDWMRPTHSMEGSQLTQNLPISSNYTCQIDT